MKVEFEGKTFEVTRKAYNTVYRDRGYKEVVDLTKQEISDKLTEKGIEHTMKVSKPELYKLLMESE